MHGRPHCRSREQRPVGDANGGQAENRAEVQGQPSAPRVIAPGRIDNQHGGFGAQVPDGGLEQRALAQRQQARLAGTAGDARANRPGQFDDRGAPRRRPGRITRRTRPC